MLEPELLLDDRPVGAQLLVQLALAGELSLRATSHRTLERLGSLAIYGRWSLRVAAGILSHGGREYPPRRTEYLSRKQQLGQVFLGEECVESGKVSFIRSVES